MSRNFTLQKAKIKTQVKRLEVSLAACLLVFVAILTAIPKHVSAAPVIDQYYAPSSSEPFGITSGSDGNLWFTEYNTDAIGRITTSGTTTSYTLPSDPYDSSSNSFPNYITSGPDGNIWFTQFGSIGSITTSGSISEYNTYIGDGAYVRYDRYIISGPDDMLWFVASPDNAGQDDVICSITSSGTVTKYDTDAPYNSIEGLTEGPDGNLWFTTSATNFNKIGEMTPTGTVTYTDAPSGNESLDDITSGPDGNLWFLGSDSTGAEYASSITTSGVLGSEYEIPGAEGFGNITSGPNGNLWATPSIPGYIVSITTSGEVSEYAVSSEGGNYNNGITVGPDDNIWFTSASANKIFKFVLPPSAPTNLTTTTPTNSAPVLNWDSVSGATSYNIYSNGGSTPIGSTSSTSFTDSSATQGTNSYYVTAINSGGAESDPSNTVYVAYDDTLPLITNFTANNGSTFARQSTPFTSGVSTQTINSDGSVTVSVNDAPGYADSGFYLYDGPLSGLPNFTVNSSSGDFGLNLWFDSANLGDFFQWDSNVLTGLGGDTYGLSSGSTDGTLSVNGDTSFFMMDNGQDYTLSQLIAGDDTTSGVNGSTNVAVWIGVDVGSGGSTSATISSIEGL